MTVSDQNFEQNGDSFISKIIRNFKPFYALYAVVPILIIYPKPLMLLLKPLLRNWSFNYRQINAVANKPEELILTSNPNINFSKQYLNNFQVVKGTLPEGFKLIQQSILNEQLLKSNQDQSMKHTLAIKRHQFQKQRIFRSFYVIDMLNNGRLKLQKSIFQSSLEMKETEIFQKQKSQLNRNNSQFNYTQTDYMWVQMILMKLKILQLQNNSQTLKCVIIKASPKVLQLLEVKILKLQQVEAFKLNTITESKLHILKFNKKLNTYEQCTASFKIQQTPYFEDKQNEY